MEYKILVAFCIASLLYAKSLSMLPTVDSIASAEREATAGQIQIDEALAQMRSVMSSVDDAERQ
jgi:outer membrane protein assembly factor BamE (lipoprotein component of BamABCDE complex)